VKRSLRWALVAVAAFVALFPFYWMLRTAVAPKDEVFFKGLALLPERLTFENFRRAWTNAGLGQAMVNGTIVTLSILAAQLVTCIPAAYVFAKLHFKGRNLLYGLVLAALLIPVQATAIPTYIGLSRLSLVDTKLSLVLPFVTSAFGIFLIRQYMTTIPDALLEAARMDGLSHLQTLRRIVVPMARPAILTFAVFSVFVHWNDYLWPLLVARSDSLRTPPLALAVFQNAELGTDYGAMAAGATVVTIPIVVLFLLAHRRFVAGIAGGEVVG
jgi:multiple sugar transport system permease protein